MWSAADDKCLNTNKSLSSLGHLKTINDKKACPLDSHTYEAVGKVRSEITPRSPVTPSAMLKR